METLKQIIFLFSLMFSILIFQMGYTQVDNNEKDFIKRLKRGESSGKYTFSKSGQILFEGKQIFKASNSSTFSVSISTSQSGIFSAIILNDEIYGSKDWGVYNWENEKIIARKPYSIKYTIFQDKVAWSKTLPFSHEKYLIIPEGWEVQSKYYIVNLETGQTKWIEIKHNDIDDCQMHYLTNDCQWINEETIKFKINNVANPWAENPKCKSDTTYNPSYVTLYIDTNKFELTK